MYFPIVLTSLIFQRTINVEEMGQRRQGPIQRRFGPSCVRQVNFLRESTAFHDMRMECKIILIHFLLLISHKSPAIACYPITPVSLPDIALIAPQLLQGLLKLCCQTSYLPQRLKIEPFP